MPAMYHLSKTAPEQILEEGLIIGRKKGFHAYDDFNPPGIYLYDDIKITRRLWPRSVIHLYRVETRDLPLEADRWGGDGAWRCLDSIGAARISHIYTYRPFEKALQKDPSL
jgi:hypothetical protein